MSKSIMTSSTSKAAIAVDTSFDSLRIVLHILRDMPPGLINRDANGLAKRVVFGSVERQKVSPQCAKAAKRENPLLRDFAQAHGLGMSVRSSDMAERLAVLLGEEGFSEKDGLAYGEALIKGYFRGDDKKDTSGGGKKPRKGKGGAEGEEAAAEAADTKVEAVKKGGTIMVLGTSEIAALVKVAVAAKGAGISAEDVAAKKWGKDPNVQKAREAVEAMAKNNVGLDGTFFGRFSTGEAVSDIDPAVLVSPWMTLHPIQSHMDFFTAQDNRLSGNGKGAAHMGFAEVASGLFYSNVVIEISTLGENLGTNDPDLLASAVEMAVRVVMTTDPSAKRGSTGASGEVFEVLAEGLHGTALTAAPFFRSTDFFDQDKAAEALRTYVLNRQRRLDALQRSERIVSLRDLGSDAFQAAVGDMVRSPVPLAQQSPNLVTVK